jgi:cytochrome d ubiquinol oxidase subunit II
MPLLVALTALAAWRSLKRGADAAPFLWALGLFALSFVGLGVSIWPDVIPGRVSIWQAAAPYQSQLFLLIGAAALIPLILAYTAWSYWVFRGKVGEQGYH